MGHTQSESPPEAAKRETESREPLIHDLFERQAQLTPDALAVADPETRLTYRELDRRSLLLARRLRELGAGPDSAVGIYMDRSSEYVVSMLAAMKAGGAFLPIELAYPQTMISEISADANPTAILTKKHHRKNLPQTHPTTICLDDFFDGDATETDEEIPEASPENLGSENLTFIAYSSGTTGKPKGISNPHKAAVNSYFWRFGTSDCEPGDLVGCNVFFIWEVLRPLLRGGASYVIPDDVIYDPHALVGLLEEEKITETLMTPSLLEATLNNVVDGDLGSRLPHLRTLWLNGEVVTKKLAARAAEALPETRLLNVYSISEAHEVAAGDLRELMDNPDSTHCPVGETIDPSRTYILDEEANPVPDGEDGELYVGGECLAREYVNLPEKTAERFPDDPFAGEGRMYKTGDRARFLPDGNLEILGRCDFMVKVRGYSIELGAVEAAIEERLPVEGCVVAADGEEGEDKRLVAYLVPKDGESFDVDARTGRSRGIRDALKDSLPHYAIPAAFVVADSLPLQETTGKVDRSELPPPPARASRRESSTEGITLPENPTGEEIEAVVARVWESVLRLDEGDVSADDNFFDIGGHSLAAAETLTILEDIFDTRLPVSLLLEAPTPASFRRMLSDEHPEARDDEPNPGSDAALDKGISPRGKAKPIPLAEARNIFLTGATGFLGAFLLDEILRRSDAEVHCLVRRKNGSSPLAPIRENMERYSLWKAEYAERISPIGGDLGSPNLGMGEEMFAEVSGDMDIAFHSAAAVNLVYPYSALKSINVDGTREILRLCCEGRPTTLHHISTNGIFSPGSGYCLEDASLDPLLDGLDEGYGISKWVAEKLVWEASERGLPVCVHRPGNIAGHSESGASNPRDFLTAMLSESVRICAAPDIPGWRMEMTPVDFVSAAISEIAGNRDSFGKAFHLANPEPPLADDIFDILESLGVALERLEIGAWMDARKKAGHSREDIVGGVLGGNPNPGSLLEENAHDDSNTRRAIEANGLERPTFDAELLANYLCHFEAMGWVSSPRAAPDKQTA